MKEKLKKGRPILLVLLLAAVVAWAGYTGYWLFQARQMVSKTEDESLKGELSVWQVSSDLRSIKKVSITTDYLAISGINEDGHIVYEESMEQYDDPAYYDTWKEQGSKYIRIKQGDLENVCQVTWTGAMFNDGVKVGG